MRNTRFKREKNRPFYSLLDGGSFFRWAGVGGNGKKTCFGDPEFHQNREKTYSLTYTTSPSETIFLLRSPTLKISLIREKPALLFWDIPVSKPVWLSGTVMQPEMTANSTYWKADLIWDHPYLPIREKNPPFDLYLMWMKNRDHLFGPALTSCT